MPGKCPHYEATAIDKQGSQNAAMPEMRIDTCLQCLVPQGLPVWVAVSKVGCDDEADGKIPTAVVGMDKPFAQKRKRQGAAVSHRQARTGPGGLRNHLTFQA